MDEFTIQEHEDQFTPSGLKVLYSTEQANDIAASAAMVESPGNDPIAVYTQIRDDLLNNGESPYLRQIGDRIRLSDNEEEDKQLLKVLADPGLDYETRIGLVQELQQERANPLPFDLEKEFLESAATNELPELPIEQEIKDIALQELDSIIEGRYNGQALILEFLDKKANEAGTPELVKDFFLTLVPTNTGFSYYNVLKQVRPELAEKIQRVLPGEALNILREEKDKLSGQAYVDFVKDVIQSVEDNGGLTGGNEFLKLILISEVFQEELDKGEGTEFFRYLEDATGLLDVLFIAQSIKGIVAANKALAAPVSLSRLGKLTKVNRSQASTTAANAINNPELAAALNTNPVTIIQDFILPSFRVNKGTVVPADTLDKLIELETKGIALADETRSFAINYSDFDKANMITRAQRELDAAIGARYYKPMSKIIDTEEGFTINAVFGMTDTKGFKTGVAALNRAKSLFTDDVPVKIMKINKQGILEDVTGQSKLQLGRFGEYFFEADMKYGYELGNAAVDQLFFREGAITGKTTKKLWTSGPQGSFAKEITRGAERGPDFGKGVTGRLSNIVKDTFKALPEDSRLKVASTIDEGSQLRINFDVFDLQARGLNDSEVKAYYGLRGTYDTEYLLSDRRFRSSMNAIGNKYIENETQGYKAFGRPLHDKGVAKSSLGKEANYVFDPHTSNIVKMTSDEIDKLYDRGGRIASLFRREEVGGRGSHYIIIDPLNNTNLKNLPDRFLLPYIPGYVTRSYEDPIYITKLKTIRIGDETVEDFVAIGTVSNRAEAERISRSLTETTKVTHDYKLSRDLLPGVQMQLEWDIKRGAINAPLVGKRGQHLVAGDSTLLARTPNFVEELQKSIEITGRKAGMEDYLKQYKLRLVNTFGNTSKDSRGIPLDVLPEIKGQSVLPKRVSEISSKTKGLTDEAKQARLAMKYLDTVQGTPGIMAEKYRQLVLNLAEWVQGSGKSSARVKAGEFLLRRQTAPEDVMSAAVSQLMIMMNPIRQRLLQMSQAVFVTGVIPGYTITGKWAKDFTMFKPAFSAFKNNLLWNKIKPVAAKGMGLSEKDLTTLVEGFYKSGLPNAIDSNEFVRRAIIDFNDEIYETFFKRAARNTVNSIKAPFFVMQKYGFGSGEFDNLAATYLVAWKRFIRDNPKRDWRSPTALAEIGGDARQLSLSMTREGSFPYQRGWLNLLFQFFAISHKSIVSVLPKKLGGSNILKPDEKARVAAFQFILFGTAAYPFLKEGVDAVNDRLGLQLSEGAKNAYVGNLIERTFNAGLSAYTDEDQRFEIATSFATGAQFSQMLTSLVRNYSMSPKEILETGFGPPVAVAGNRVWTALENTGFLFLTRDLSDPETYTLALSNLGSILPAYNNYLKSSAALQFKTFHDRSGDPTVKATFEAAMAKGLIGMTTKDEQEFYQMKAKIAEAKGSNPGQGNRLDEIAQTYIERITNIAVYHADRGRETGNYDLYERMYKEAVNIENYVWSYLDPLDRSVLVNRIQSKLQKLNESGENKLFNAIVELSTKGDSGADVDSIIRAAKNRELFDDPRQVEMLRQIEGYIMDAKELEQGVSELREQRLGNQ